MTLNAKDVAAILQALEGSTFDSLELEMEGVKLQLRRTSQVAVPTPATAPAPSSSAGKAPTAAPRAVTAQPSSAAAASVAVADVPAGTTAVPAPMLGIFYRAPKPGEPAFVEVGTRVEAHSIIGIIEVMKLMNTVRAGVRGEVVAIPARNGELVEYGEALLFVRPH